MNLNFSPERAKRSLSPPNSPRYKRRRGLAVARKSSLSLFESVDFSSLPLAGPARTGINELTAMLQGEGMHGPAAARALSNVFKRQHSPGLFGQGSLAALLDGPSGAAAAGGPAPSPHWPGAAPDTLRMDAADVIRIDVGGAIFKTRRGTLTSVPGSLLAGMFGRSPLAVFVDRDPAWFELIVGWLRDRRAPPNWPMGETLWVHEVEHFGLTEAMFGEGCIYVIGGEDGDGPFGTGELYDPVRREWRDIAEMPIKRVAHAVAILDGTLHVSGGYDEQGHTLDSVCRLDTKSASWKPLPSMSMARCRHQMVAAGGALYAIGGMVSKVAGRRRRDAFMERYDPHQCAWTVAADPREPRYGFATALVDSKIYIIGGLKLNGARATQVERYDVTTGVWDVIAPMLTPRAYLSCAVLDGKIYAIGGNDDRNSPLSITEIYDPGTDAWGAGPSMSSPRCDAGIVSLNGALWICGGEDDENYLSTVEIYDPVARCWQQGPAMPDPKSSLVVCVAPF